MNSKQAQAIAQQLRALAETDETVTDAGNAPLENYHGWANGKEMLASFLVKKPECPDYRLLILKWHPKRSEEYYLVVYHDRGTRGTGPKCEWKTIRDGQLWWKYSPKSRDGQNPVRIRSFKEKMGSVEIGLALPETPEQASSFVDEIVAVAETKRSIDEPLREARRQGGSLEVSYLERLFPEPDERQALLGHLAALIEYTHSKGYTSWVLTRRKTLIRLNVARIRVLDLFMKDRVVVVGRLPSDGEWPGDLERFLREEGGPFKTGEGIWSFEFTRTQFLEYSDTLLPLVKDAIDQVGHHKSPVRRSHDPHLVEEIALETGRDLPTNEENADGEKSVGAWLFQANPSYFDIRGALAELDELWWGANQNKKHMEVGARVYFWESGSDGGLIGSGTLASDPEMSGEDEEAKKFWRKTDELDEEKLRVRVQVDTVLDQPITRSSLQSHQTLQNLPVLRFPNATNYRLTAQQDLDLQRLIGGETTNPRYWLLAAGSGSSLWDDFYDSGEIRIGFAQDIGDIGGLTREQIENRLPEGDEDRRRTNDLRALHDFASVMEAGDRILVKQGRRRVIGYGIVSSDYRFEEDNAEMQHVRDANWLARGAWELPEDVGLLPMKTLTEVPADSELLEYILPRVQTEDGSEGPEDSYSVDDAMQGLFLHRDKLVRIMEALRSRKNVILQGPPGVGKTFVARRLAYALMGEEDPKRVGFVQFHQAMTYEDFVQGWRPAESGGFQRKNGLFYEFCARAGADSERPYVFVIDEINRGNLSKILGELMMLIEPDKRGPKYAIPLTYSHSPSEKFFVPANVYLLGMMNTADRSLALVDYALRRRFRFFSLEPRFASDAFASALQEAGAADPIRERIIANLNGLNAEISADAQNLGPGYQIGHSFFCPVGEGPFDDAWYSAVIDAEVLPLLHEYWFDKPEKVDEWSRKLKA